jgi:hypothetical protein
LVCAGRYEEALHEGLEALDIAQNEVHPHLAMAEAYLAQGASPKPWLPQRGRVVTSRSNPWLRGCWQLPWGRAWYHLLCSEVDAAAGWYEKMIDARDLFAVAYANSLYTKELRASPHWAKLARMMNLAESTA